eukprot:9592518-Alexandrium_andersonii.AAC.1
MSGCAVHRRSAAINGAHHFSRSSKARATEGRSDLRELRNHVGVAMILGDTGRLLPVVRIAT